ncbi:peptidoglycan DD-metalloendopeptidase family protein [Legionella fallonii]|uniref:Novel lipoprotein homolog NlpD n=1 Tax=Legionella fallonii LLAP-10 TaxID=1212491 RepID=A0A098G3U6_9GAMM|nr:peptidoglycan DD-metalloendopeptidase family protein [Legionella fallonii]CEG56656.1 Novel lipoprotein homolog NlpD [Legionella fallonii LLAP-10]
MLTLCKNCFCLFLILILAGCGTRHALAPVSELKWQPYSRYQKTHTVRRGETLFAIAFRYDTDYRSLARVNRLRPPYSLRVGQVLSLQGIRRRAITTRPISARRYSQPKPRASQRVIYSPAHNVRSASGWLWPVSGHVTTTFIPTQGKKGINIACKKGERVRASSGGVVAYAGSGLAGYGNLIIIKHNNEYLTAYGHNARNLVAEGQRVKAGQVIAIAGMIDRKYWGVHFEIRKAGTPVNPLNYLQKG